MQQNWDWLAEICICEDKISSIKLKEEINTIVMFWEVCDTKHFFSKFEKVKDSPETLLIKKRNSSQRGETFSQSQNKCKIVSGELLQK